MGRTIDETVMAQVRPLVAQGLNGAQIATALGLKERDGRWYAAQVRAEGATNGQGHAPTLPAATTEDVPLDAFVLGEATQVRARLDPAVIDEYFEAMTEGAVFPAVVLFTDGDLYWIGDGWHRIAAARKVGFTTIRAEVRPGAKREALLYACSANASHGLRRTNADKRQAVDTLLRDPEWGQWSNGAIAKHCGVSDELVRLRRADRPLPTVGSDDGQRTYTTKHGTVATMNVTHIGTRQAMDSTTNGEPADEEAAAVTFDPDELARWQAAYPEFIHPGIPPEDFRLIAEGLDALTPQARQTRRAQWRRGDQNAIADFLGEPPIPTREARRSVLLDPAHGQPVDVRLDHATPPDDPEADADQFLRLRDRLCARWTTPLAVSVMRRTFKQLLNELPGGINAGVEPQP